MGGSGNNIVVHKKILRRTKSEPSLKTWETSSRVGYDTEKPNLLLDDSDRALFETITVDAESISAVDALKISVDAPTLVDIGVEKTPTPRGSAGLLLFPPLPSTTILIYESIHRTY